MACKLSLVIPCKDKNDPKLQELLKSIEVQDFNKAEMEVLIITEGTSESAKAIGIRKAKGEVIGILASDNELISNDFLSNMHEGVSMIGATYPLRYFYTENDNILNRYFSLIGGNDPLSYYMNKNDRASYLNENHNIKGSIGDNGFFIRRNLIKATDLDNYYHIDNAIESKTVIQPFLNRHIWHKTGGNIFRFFQKRYRYGLQHAFNKNRRWHLVDFKQPKDIMRFLWFLICSLTVIQPLILSVRGYLKIRDVAWFLHPVVCLMTLIVYGLLVIHLAVRGAFRWLSRSLSVPMAGRRV